MSTTSSPGPSKAFRGLGRMPGDARGRPSTSGPEERVVQVPAGLQKSHIDDEKPTDPVRHPFERSDVDDAGAPPQGGVPGPKEGIPGKGDPSTPTQDPGQGLDELGDT